MTQSSTFLTGFLTPTAVRWLLFNLLLAVSLGAGAAGTPTDSLRRVAAAGESTPFSLRTIVIDPGHGGYDPGCSGAHSTEKHIALGIAKELKIYFELNYPELRVLLTRETDKFVTLEDRAEMANNAQADLFLSIHCNSMTNSAATRGSETYVFGISENQTTLSIEERENAVIKLEDNYQERYGFDPDSPEGHILLSMYQHAYLTQSLQFAELVEKRMATVPNHRSRGVKQAAFVVLREATMPSVLVETGFLTNGIDEKLLLQAVGQQQIARAVFDAFVDFKLQVENGTTRPVIVEAEPLPTPSAVVSAPVISSPSTPAPGSSINVSANMPIATGGPVLAVEYCVQLAAAKSEIPTDRGKWVRLTFPYIVRPEGGLLKYQVAQLGTYAAARAAQAELKKEGFADTWIVAYHNGVKISAKEARKLTGE